MYIIFCGLIMGAIGVTIAGVLYGHKQVTVFDGNPMYDKTGIPNAKKDYVKDNIAIAKMLGYNPNSPTFKRMYDNYLDLIV